MIKKVASIVFASKVERVPIIFITKDRTEVLKESIKSLEPIKEWIDLVIHDNGSTFPGMHKYLQELKEQGASIYRNHPTGDLRDISESVAKTVETYFRDSGTPAKHYVVSDPDIALDEASELLLQTYTGLLARFPHINVVGPMLRIDDLPDHYPLKSKVIESHTEQFWHKEPKSVVIGSKTVLIQDAPIDTTFGMYRRGFAFKRLNMGIRVYAPFCASHLDWYLNPESLSLDQLHYMEQASDVAHWGAGWLKSKLAE